MNIRELNVKSLTQEFEQVVNSVFIHSYNKNY